MPELIEAELYRGALDPFVGWTVTDVDAVDPHYLRPADVPPEVFDQLVGHAMIGARRYGKVVLVDLEPDSLTVGLRFGMTGRLVIDDDGPIDRLEYASPRNEPGWDRFRFTVTDKTGATSHDVAMRDPRRLGSVELDPDLSSLGPDATTVNPEVLASRFERRSAPVKAALLNQAVVAGLGNLLADEILFDAALQPMRRVNELSDTETEALAASIADVVGTQLELGGSHTGPLFPHRHDGGRCPRDGAELSLVRTGGRSSWYCPAHQH